MIFTVPEDDGSDFSTLGFQLVEYYLDNLVHGPGDLSGEPLRLDDDKIGFILRMYEIYPQGHEFGGMRRYDRCGLSLPKGVAKTELGAIIAAGELDPDAPVRCCGWDAHGEPIGRGLRDPFIPMVAYTEEQSDELAYGALRKILLGSKIAEKFDIGLERIVRVSGEGKAVSLASSPGARDGARTTWQLFDEGHRMTTPELLKAHETMLNNMPKRSVLSDPWTLEISTAFDPGERSVAKRTMAFAEAVRDGKVKNARLFFFHSQASEKHDLETAEGRRAAIIEARGPHASKWSSPDRIASLRDDPETDKDYWARVWLNQIRHNAARAFDPRLWDARVRPGYVVEKGAPIALGFDGSLTNDATALIATEIPTGFQFPLGIWERPFDAPDGWRVPEREVDAAVARAFEQFSVWRFYGDPYWWETWLAAWEGKHGERVVRWPTTNEKKTAFAVRAFVAALAAPADGESAQGAPEERMSHPGDAVVWRHIANAHKRYIGSHIDETGERLYVIQKERKDSPKKMDAAMASVLSWQCRLDALAAGDWKPSGGGVYERRGPLVFGGAKA